MSLIDLPILFKRASGGAVVQWQIRVDPHDDGTATIITTHGQVGGQLQESTDHIKEGKNPGKKNETTAQQQAIKEAEAKWTKQRDRKHYGLTVEESDAKIAAAPMLAQVFEDHQQKVNWDDKDHLHVQPKFDGHRCLAFIDGRMQIKLFSRQGIEITTVPHIVDQLYSAPPNSIIDGELYIHGESLNKIGSYIKREQEGSANLCYMIYDIADPKRPFSDRLQTLLDDCGQFEDESHLHLARTQNVGSLDEAMEFQAAAIENGYEGAMLRHGTEGYKPGKRSDGLLKMKTFIDGEFVVTGCKEGRGQFAGMAVFECVTPDGNPFDVTAPGTHDEKRAYWNNKDQYTGKRLTVKYQTMTNTEAPVPFLPVAKGFVDPNV